MILRLVGVRAVFALVWSIHEYFQFSSIRKGKNLAWARNVLRVQIVRNTVLKPLTVTGRLIAKNRFPIRGQIKVMK